MLLLFISTPIVKRLNRTEVSAIVKLAPTGRRSLTWWQAWLADHW